MTDSDEMNSILESTIDTIDSTCGDCSAFMNLDEDELESEREKAIVFLSLVDTVKVQHVLDATLEAKAVKLLEYVIPYSRESADAFLISHGRTTDESLTNFVQCIVVLLSSASQTITTAAMRILEALIWKCSAQVHFAFVKADLIPHLINTLNLQQGQ
ncbi:hypothetical protein BLNAU_14386 [Blattamonas nauphoetae]|uniref:Uncharacterized protein n=1 Tax=Blattamonas nauphoetae TaxID=2049346 RepID=A0ABQ9XHP5_9EUKA|nr:hypothetical protein BLNAU_14386 [Blattamonas nauphoetae]